MEIEDGEFEEEMRIGWKVEYEYISSIILYPP